MALSEEQLKRLQEYSKKRFEEIRPKLEAAINRICK